MREKNAYFTVEAALVIPVVISVMLFVIYMLLFQYNRCLLEQDMGALTLWGSSMEGDDAAALEEKTRERMHGIYMDKYVVWEITELKAELQKNKFMVKGAGQLIFPFPGWNFWSAENVWGAEAEYSGERLSPVTFIRLCRGIQNGLKERAESE